MSDSSQSAQNKPVIGISIGDYNGIGPEVVIKTLEDNRLLKLFTPVIFCDAHIIGFYRKHFDLQNFNYHQVQSVDQIHHRKLNVVAISDLRPTLNPGTGDKESGKYALLSLQKAVEAVKAGKVNAICTAPLSKELVQSETFSFPGHTEYLTAEAGVQDSLMFLISEDLRVGVVTGHIPLKDVSSSLTKDRLKSKLRILIHSLKKDFGKKKPRIAVLGLNPHAGENGLLGTEELEIISPVIHELKEGGNLIFGPFPADGFFGNNQFQNFDGILAMYHDQGLIPFKSMAFDSGVNYTAGLPFIRTSPDHGTAFSIAGKGVADTNSFRNALFTAKEIVLHRQENQ